MAHSERGQATDTTTSPTTGEAQRDEKYDVNERFLSIVDGEYNSEEEKILDQKYDSLWQPTWMGHDRKWRIATRLFICGLAIALIWLTSLKLATTIASLYVASPTYQEAFNQWEKSVDLSRAERLTSEACANRQMQVCDQILGVRIQELVSQSEAARDADSAQLALMQYQVNLCSTNWENTIVTTSKFLQQDVSLTDIYLSGANGTDYGAPNGTYYCSPEEISYLTSLLQDATQEKNDVYRYNSQYAGQSNNIVDNATAQMEARVAYDQEYAANKTNFLGNVTLDLGNLGDIYSADLDFQMGQIDAPLNDMVNCLSLSTGSTCPTGAMRWFSGVKTDVENQVALLSSSFNANLALSTNFFSQATAWKNQAVSALTAVQNVADQIKNVIDVSVFNIGGLVTSWPTPPPLQTNINLSSPLVPLPPVNLTAPFVNSFNANLGQIKINVGHLGEFWKEDVNFGVAGLPNMFSDYNPPPLYLDNLSWHENTDSFLTASKLSLGEINTDVSVNTSGFNASAAAADFASALTFSPFALLTEDFTGSVDLYNSFGALGTILFLLVTADVIWRVWQTVGFLRQYKRMSQIGVPEIDVRNFEADKQSANPTLQTYKLLTSPWVIIFIIGVIAFIILLALISIYIPLYESYVSGCTQSNNGTLLTHNAYSFAYNYAATPYNDVIAHGLRDYDKNRTDKCDSRQVEFQTDQDNFQNSWDQNVYTYNQKQPDLVLFQKCIDRTKLPNDTIFQASLNGRRSPFLPSIEAIRVQNCSAPGAYGNTSGLQSCLLNCSVLPLCHITCSGPDKLALAASTYDSGCTSEWMFHAGLFRFLVALLIYVSLNISRVLVMTAVIRLAWRTLSTNGFEFRGTCTKLGEIEGFNDKLKVELDKSVRSYERGALLMLIFAVLVHIPYIVVLTRYGDVLSHDAQFNN